MSTPIGGWPELLGHQAGWSTPVGYLTRDVVLPGLVLLVSTALLLLALVLVPTLYSRARPSQEPSGEPPGPTGRLAPIGAALAVSAAAFVGASAPLVLPNPLPTADAGAPVEPPVADEAVAPRWADAAVVGTTSGDGEFDPRLAFARWLFEHGRISG